MLIHTYIYIYIARTLAGCNIKAAKEKNYIFYLHADKISQKAQVITAAMLKNTAH